MDSKQEQVFSSVKQEGDSAKKSHALSCLPKRQHFSLALRGMKVETETWQEALGTTQMNTDGSVAGSGGTRNRRTWQSRNVLDGRYQCCLLLACPQGGKERTQPIINCWLENSGPCYGSAVCWLWVAVLRREIQRAEEKALSVDCLPHKHEDLSPTPNTHEHSWTRQCTYVTSVLQRAGACRPASLTQSGSSGSSETLPQEKKMWSMTGGRQQHGSPDPTQRHTHMYMCTKK